MIGVEFVKKRVRALFCSSKGEAKPVPFQEVLKHEHNFIRDNRSRVHRRASGDASPAEEAVLPELPLDDGSRHPNKALETFGLALSGGGIRSATFNLGVLQALAEQKLLSNLDYLSTVSGGGYIGCWLMAWISRDGDVRNVEKLLEPCRVANVAADRHLPEGSPTVFDEEPTPIHHLRAYSSYLALRSGPLSVHSWALIAIYLRNVFLNALAFIPFFSTIVLFVALLFRVYAAPFVGTPLVMAFLAVLATLPPVVAVVLLAGSLHVAREPNRECSRVASASYIAPVSLLVIGLFAISTLAGNAEVRSTFRELFSPLEPWLRPVEPYGYFVIGGLVHTLVNGKSWITLVRPKQGVASRMRALGWLIASFVAGLLLVAIAYWCLMGMNSIPDATVGSFTIDASSLRFIIAVPSLIVLTILAEQIQVGTLGRIESKAVREKWAYFHATCLLTALVWLLLAIVVLVPPILVQSHEMLWATYGSAISWALTSGLTVYLAHRSSADGTKATWQDRIIQVGPIVFLVGAVASLSGALFSMFDIAGAVAPMERGWGAIPEIGLCLGAVGSLVVAALLGSLVDVNVFSLHEMYENRLTRTFLGASRPPRKRFGAPFRSMAPARHEDPVTLMDMDDDLLLRELVPERTEREDCRGPMGPLLLVNTALNRLSDSPLNRQERRADSFVLGSSGISVAWGHRNRVVAA